MRQSQKNNRARGRGRKPSNPLSRSYDSNGPDVKIRGTASHIAEKYQSLARDAQASGDIVLAENYYQHAEHYLRIIASAQAANRDFDRGGAANGNGDQPNVKPSRRPQAQTATADAAEETNATEAEEAEAPSETGNVAAFDASDPAAEQPVVEAPVSEEVEVPAPPKPRRRRTSYRSRKKPAANEASNAEASAPVSLADAPQPVVADE